MAATMKAKRMLVSVKRSQMEVTPISVFGHEIPILELMYGEGNVLRINPLPEGVDFKPYEGIETLNVTAEMDRLINRWGRDASSGTSWAETTFGPRNRSILDRYAFDPKKDEDNLPAHASNDGVVSREKPAVDKDTNGYLKVDEIKTALDSLQVDYADIKKRDDLLARLDAACRARLTELGIEFEEDAATAELFALIPAEEE